MNNENLIRSARSADTPSAEPALTLYQYATCPICRMVSNRLEALGLDYRTVEVSPSFADPDRRYVIERCGCGTVPVLHDSTNDVWLGESGDILRYLDGRFALRDAS